MKNYSTYILNLSREQRVLSFYEENDKNAKMTKREFNIKSTKTIRDWVKKKDSLQGIMKSLAKQRRNL